MRLTGASQLVALGLAALAAGCFSHFDPPIPPLPPELTQLDQQNMPPWTGRWSIIGRGKDVVRFAQSFTPGKSALTAVEIDIMTGNSGRRSRGDLITVSIVESTRTLARAGKAVSEGFDGWLRFEFPKPVKMASGVPIWLRVEDTNQDVFGWRYGEDTYAAGVAYFNGTPWQGGVFDFRFRTYGY